MTVYYRPETLADALDIAASDPVTLAAGCTDLFPATERQALAGPVLDLTAIHGLRGITDSKDGWRIGATTTWSDVNAAPLPAAFDMLKQAAREVGSVQIQNAGTVAGNICNASPAADGVPPLLALDASVEIASLAKTRSLPLAGFVTGPRATQLAPGEIVTGVTVPRSAGQGCSALMKLGARKYLVISIAMVAARLTSESGVVTSAALSIGSCSPVARRLAAVEAALVGTPVDAAEDAITAEDVAAALDPIDDIRADRAYRITAATELLRRAVASLADPSLEDAA